jgi:Zn-dependent M28 family amino/carboxypeptidase
MFCLKPKRSLIFVWHAGEERGLYGSKYFADNPSVPIDRIVAQLDMDLIGRKPRQQRRQK